MSHTLGSPEPERLELTDPCTKKDIQAQLEKMVASSVFRDSPTVSALLQFVVASALQSKEIKEDVIAVELFQKQDYDKTQNRTVSVTAGRLREKLTKYYRTEGQGDSIAIDLPVGRHYVPVFKQRDALGPRFVNAPLRADISRIAILPFWAEPADEYFSYGLTEALTSGLVTVEGLRVVSRMSAYQFRGQAMDIRQVGSGQV